MSSTATKHNQYRTTVILHISHTHFLFTSSLTLYPLLTTNPETQKLLLPPGGFHVSFLLWEGSVSGDAEDVVSVPVEDVLATLRNNKELSFILTFSKGEGVWSTACRLEVLGSSDEGLLVTMQRGTSDRGGGGNGVDSLSLEVALTFDNTTLDEVIAVVEEGMMLMERGGSGGGGLSPLGGRSPAISILFAVPANCSTALVAIVWTLMIVANNNSNNNGTTVKQLVAARRGVQLSESENGAQIAIVAASTLSGTGSSLAVMADRLAPLLTAACDGEVDLEAGNESSGGWNVWQSTGIDITRKVLPFLMAESSATMVATLLLLTLVYSFQQLALFFAN